MARPHRGEYRGRGEAIRLRHADEPSLSQAPPPPQRDDDDGQEWARRLALDAADWLSTRRRWR